MWIKVNQLILISAVIGRIPLKLNGPKLSYKECVIFHYNRGSHKLILRDPCNASATHYNLLIHKYFYEDNLIIYGRRKGKHFKWSWSHDYHQNDSDVRLVRFIWKFLQRHPFSLIVSSEKLKFKEWLLD